METARQLEAKEYSLPFTLRKRRILFEFITKKKGLKENFKNYLKRARFSKNLRRKNLSRNIDAETKKLRYYKRDSLAEATQKSRNSKTSEPR